MVVNGFRWMNFAAEIRDGRWIWVQ
uniref:Uncharacterized protein n=1 Tax=Arundo donax TaxID=35708 RepID=A0A0A9B638_ARUDO